MAKSNYPNGFEHGVTIRGVPVLNTYSGSVHYVDSVYGSNGHNGTYQWPRASIDYLFTNDLVTAGDIIICKPGHVETVAAATTYDIAGVCIIFDGEGSSRAYYNMTATGSCVTITGAGITIIKPKFVSAIDAIVKAVYVTGADVTIVDAEYHDAAAKAATIQVSASGADRLAIKGYKFFASTTGTQKTEAIKTATGTGMVLENIQIVGDFSNGCINISSAAVDINMNGLDLQNTNSGPKPGIAINANTTGFAENIKCRVDSGTDYVSSTAKIQWGPLCQGYNTDGSGGAAIGSATDITAAVDSVGVQASTVQSKTDSVGLTASTASSQIASVGVTASTTASYAADAVTSIDSVGVQTSAAQSITISRATATDSRADSVGIQTSTVNSLAQSVGILASTAISNASAARSAAQSAAIGASVANANVLSTALSVASTAASVGTGTSNANANAISATSAATSAAVGASTANANVISTSNSVVSVGNSVGTGTSVCNANVISTSNSVTSAATSLGIGVSTTVNVTAQITSILNSFALIISTINSNTA